MALKQILPIEPYNTLKESSGLKTDEAVAKRADISIASLYAAKTKGASSRTLQALAIALEVSVKALLGQEESRNNRRFLIEKFFAEKPVTKRGLLVGRATLIEEVSHRIASTHQPGHSFVFGPRGVGKTSLLEACKQSAKDAGFKNILEAWAEASSTFESLMEEALGRPVSSVRQALGLLFAMQPVAIVIEEVDQLVDRKAIAALGTLIHQATSRAKDGSINVVLVGVDGAWQAVGGHASAGRSISWIQVAKLPAYYCCDHFRHAGTETQLEFDAAAVARIEWLSLGYPFAWNLYGLHAALKADEVKAERVSEAHVESAEDVVAHKSLAITVRTKEHLLKGREVMVMRAAALAKQGDFRWFFAADVKTVLEKAGHALHRTDVRSGLEAGVSQGLLEKRDDSPNHVNAGAEYRFKDAQMEPGFLMRWNYRSGSDLFATFTGGSGRDFKAAEAHCPTCGKTAETLSCDSRAFLKHQEDCGVDVGGSG